jgi:hypothetical protein
MRDLVFSDPWPIVRRHCRNLGFEIPETVHRYREHQTATGPCDLLIAWENNLVVVEMKRDIIDDAAVTQCLRYMGSLGARFGGVVSGVVCAPDISNAAKFALYAAMSANTPISYYQFLFSYDVPARNVGVPEPPLDKHLHEIVYPKDALVDEQNVIEQARSIVTAAKEKVQDANE